MVSSLLTTRDAAAYCGFKTTGALRKVRLEGRIVPAGRRGGTGTWMWAREELDRFLRGEAPAKMVLERPGAPPEGGTHGKHENWKLFKNSWISTKPVLPGVWQRKEGGHVVRARVLTATTGPEKEIWKVLPDADAPAALQWLTFEKERVRAGGVSVEPRKMRFAEYATSLFARKVETKEIRSAKGR